MDNKKIIAYHGSQNSNISLEDRPMYLTDSKEQAIEFAKGYMFNYELYDGEIPTVYKMELDIKNPKYITDEDEYEDIMVDTRMSVKNLTNDGYDGMIYNDGYQTYYAVISAKNQCKIIGKKRIDESTINESYESEVSRISAMSENEIVDYCGGIENDIPDKGPVYITPSGTIIDIYNSDANPQDDIESCTHMDFWYGFVDDYMSDEYAIAEEVMNKFEDEGWLRINTGNTEAEDRCYCSLPDNNKYKIKSSQYDALEKFIDKCVSLNKKEVEINCGSERKSYSLKEYTAEDIIKKIRRYYSSGKLYESEESDISRLEAEARKNGYTKKAYHGTYNFGRTSFDRYNVLFLTDDVQVARNFAGGQPQREIGREFDPKTASDKSLIEFADNNTFAHDIRIATIDDFDREIERVSLSQKDAKKYFGSEWQDAMNKAEEKTNVAKKKKERFLNGEKFFYMSTNSISKDYANDPLFNRETLENFVATYNDSNRYKGGGVYSLYFKPGKMLSIECDGNYYTDVPIPKELEKFATPEELKRGMATSDQIVRMAHSAGYDSIEYKNMMEGGDQGYAGVSNVYVVFDPKHNVKSADLVTYDDNGDIIPIEKRFNSSSADIREDVIEENAEDYHTGEAVGKDIFDDRTHTPYYDGLLKNPKEAERENLQAEIVMMSPNEYFEECSKYGYGHYVPVSRLKEQRRADKNILDDLADVVENHHRRLFLPYINYADPGQEGLHRMMYAGDRFGWDEKFPVLVVKYIDEEKQKEKEEKERQTKIKNKLYKAVQRSSVYSYDTFDEFKEQLKWDISIVFYEDKEFSVSFDENNIIINCEGAEIKVPKDDVDIKSYDEKYDDLDELSIDDLSIDDIMNS